MPYWKQVTWLLKVLRLGGKRMVSSFVRFIANRYMAAKKKERFTSFIAMLSLIGIMLGVATLIVVMSVMNGFRVELQDRIIGLNGHFHLVDVDRPLENYEELIAHIETAPSVKSVYPIIQSQALIHSNGYSQGVVVRGLPPKGIAAKPLLTDSIIKGEFTIENFKGMKAIIGSRLARYLDVTIGDQVTLISPSIRQTAFGSFPRQMGIEIMAVFDVGMYEYDQNFLFIPLETAEKFYDLENAVNSLEILIYDPSDTYNARRQISPLMGPYQSLTDWQNTSGFFDALMVERNVMFIILTMMIAIAAFNIISGMLMLVKEKSKGIAILRTMGASRKNILSIFLIMGLRIGFIGTVLGLIIGLLFVEYIDNVRLFIQYILGQDLFSAEVYYLTNLPAVLKWDEVIKICILSMTLSFLAAIYPAWRATKLDPVEALRYE